MPFPVFVVCEKAIILCGLHIYITAALVYAGFIRRRDNDERIRNRVAGATGSFHVDRSSALPALRMDPDSGGKRPNRIMFNTSGCFDQGPSCSGWGHVVVRMKAELIAS